MVVLGIHPILSWPWPQNMSAGQGPPEPLRRIITTHDPTSGRAIFSDVAREQVSFTGFPVPPGKPTTSDYALAYNTTTFPVQGLSFPSFFCNPGVQGQSRHQELSFSAVGPIAFESAKWHLLHSYWSTSGFAGSDAPNSDPRLWCRYWGHYRISSWFRWEKITEKGWCIRSTGHGSCLAEYD